MKRVEIDQINLEGCIDEIRHGNLIVTRGGEPVALVVDIAGMDEEQIELGASDRFWKLIEERRQQRTISRSELEQRLIDVGIDPAL